MGGRARGGRRGWQRERYICRGRGRRGEAGDIRRPSSTKEMEKGTIVITIALLTMRRGGEGKKGASNTVSSIYD